MSPRPFEVTAPDIARQLVVVRGVHAMPYRVQIGLPQDDGTYKYTTMGLDAWQAIVEASRKAGAHG